MLYASNCASCSPIRLVVNHVASRSIGSQINLLKAISHNRNTLCLICSCIISSWAIVKIVVVVVRRKACGSCLKASYSVLNFPYNKLFTVDGNLSANGASYSDESVIYCCDNGNEK